MKVRLTRVAFLAAAVILMTLPACGGGVPEVLLSPSATPSAVSIAHIDGIGRQVEIAGDAAHFPDNLDITAVAPEGYMTADPDDPSVAIPPTSGRHWDRWASCGFYTEPVPDERIVHNMEHGNIIVSYNLTDPAEIDALKAAYESIGLTAAWGVARPMTALRKARWPSPPGAWLTGRWLELTPPALSGFLTPTLASWGRSSPTARPAPRAAGHNRIAMKLRLTRAAFLAAAIILMTLPACGGGAPAALLSPAPSPAATPSATSADAPSSTPATPTAMATTVAPPPLALTPASTPTAAGAATPAGAITAGTPGIAATFAPPPSPALPTAAPTPVAAPASPTPAAVAIDQAPPTDGPVRVAIMPSRDHFAATLRIADVAPEGYNTIPPTSGRHWDAWSDCGFYNYPLPDELLVHNLEHGNIVISYNLADDAEVAELRAAVAAVPLAAEFAIVRRYPRLPPGMVALAAWGALDRMLGVDAGRIAGFFEQYPGTAGPEFPNGLPCTTGVRMTPSTGG